MTAPSAITMHPTRTSIGTKNLMKLAKPAICLLVFALTATNGACAQAAEQNERQRAGQTVQKPMTNADYEKLLNDAEAWIKNGRPADAYALLEPLEFEHAGEVRFDYLIGIAALDSGKPDKATFAFERVLAVNPDLFAARLDMARALYQLGDLPRARTEFSVALGQNPSKAARANIQQYLDAIDAQREGKRMRLAGYIEGSIGHDSNINSSTGQQQIFVDQFASTATLDPSNVKVPDSFYTVAAGGEIDFRLNGNWGIYTGIDARQRSNNTHNQFDTLVLDARAGVMFASRADRIRVSMLGSQSDLDGSRNSDASGMKGELRHVFSPANQMNIFAQSVQYRFADAVMQPNDIDQLAIGLGWLHALTDGQSSLSASVHYGTEKDVSPIITVASPGGGRNDGGKRYSGFRVGSQTALGERTTLFASAGLQTGDYSKANYYFLRQRHDRLYDLRLGAEWHWDTLWTLRPQLTYVRNDSNITIYGYDRMAVSLTVRREFR